MEYVYREKKMSNEENTQKLNNKKKKKEEETQKLNKKIDKIEELKPSLLEFSASPSITPKTILGFIATFLVLLFGAFRAGNPIWIILFIIFFAIFIFYRYSSSSRYIFTKEGIEVYGVPTVKREWSYFKYYYMNDEGVYLSPTVYDKGQLQFMRRLPHGVIIIPWNEEHKIKMLELIKHYISYGEPIPDKFLQKRY